MPNQIFCLPSDIEQTMMLFLSENEYYNVFLLKVAKTHLFCLEVDTQRINSLELAFIMFLHYVGQMLVTQITAVGHNARTRHTETES